MENNNQPDHEFDDFDPAEMQRIDQTKVMNGFVTPRPIAWVSTIGSAGVNLAPFSYFNVVAVDPPIVMFSASIPFGDRAGTVKDTLQNIAEVPEFVLHIVDEPLVGPMNESSRELPRGANEFEAAGLTELASTKVHPPRIAEASVQLECKLMETKEMGRIPYTLVFGEVVAIHARKGLVNERFHVDQELHRPIGRMGGASQYTTTEGRFTLKNSHIRAG